MATIPKPATVLERCRVAPAPPPNGSDAAEHPQTLPLVFSDMVWLHFHPTQRLLFYKFPCSKDHFIEHIVPNFKKPLSQALKHFLPFAGNLIYEIDSGNIPELQYRPGDSVPVTVAESNEASDFDYLSGDRPRDAGEFYAFFPDFPPDKIESGWKKIPLLAVQITLFPDTGICIGFNNNHIVGDASSVVGFIKAWSSICRHGGDEEFSSATHLHPFYDRSVIKDPTGLLNNYWNQMKHVKIESPPLNFPTNKLRATYILQKSDIQNLRNLVQAQKQDLVHLSSFTITTAYVWTCLAKSSAAAGEEVAADETEYFVFAVDARQRINPPAPATYFGNCVVPAFAESTHSELKGKNGFLTAVGLVGDVISKKANNKDEILRGADEWLAKLGGMIGKRLFGVAGSPKFDLYDADFGWGNPNKYESVGIDVDGSMSLCKSREFEGGLEIGLSLPKKKMDAFGDVFCGGLKITEQTS
uniref:Quercetin 3-O-glucoside-6''-O-malonyltransferase n=1 Tax=Verbena hybrida TaxID=76714 RepID=Q6RFS6_VERHY|nr:quercetin 3-O-glucoside-6''-O-malonyltransferase [Glandularia x hybrida]